MHDKKCDLLRETRIITKVYFFVVQGLSLPLSDKVKQLHGDCIAYNKATTIWLLPVVDNSVTKHDHLIQ